MNDAAKRRRKQRRQRELVVRKALRNRDATREQLLAQGRKLARRRAENVESARTEDESNATNPSVHSTLPAMDTNEQAAARHSHSTVPKRPEGSTVTPAPRLYGRRLYERIAPGAPADDERASEEATDGQPAGDRAADDGAADGANGCAPNAAGDGGDR